MVVNLYNLVQTAVFVQRLGLKHLNEAIMDHVSAITKYIQTLKQADDLHILVLEGPGGWGKTTAVHAALKAADFNGVNLGAYTTSLNFFNFLHHNSDQIIIADDCAGLLSDQSSMAILKAATWPQGSERRLVKWGSTSSKAEVAEFEFTGKIIIVTNRFPATIDGDAIKSRGFSKRIDITVNEAKDLLFKAASDTAWFKNTKVAKLVANFLATRITETTLPKISYRTLVSGYRLAEIHPDSWQELLAPMLPKEPVDPHKLVLELSRKDLKVKDQLQIFVEKTNLKERSFYVYRNAAGLSRSR